jgi:ribose transport system ATP-binding protein
MGRKGRIRVLCTATTVCPDGTLEGDAVDMGRVINMMVGGKMDNGKWTMENGMERAPSISHSPLSISHSPPLLSLRGWTVPSAANPRKNAVEAVSFELRAGEVVGLAGLMGAGRTELAESLCGLYPVRGLGEIRIEGRAYVPRDARHALRHGIALLGEDRRGKGIFPDKSVRVNMTCSALRNWCRSGSLGMIPDEHREREAVAAQVESLRIKTAGTDFPMAHLSGGNQQKSLFGRALLTRPRILILDEPTRGVDVGAKEEIYALIRRLAGEGMGILLISSETEEVLRLAGRVIVLRGGRAVAERPASDLSLESALALASGGLPDANHAPDAASPAKDSPA